MKTVTANSSICTGSLKSGYMHITVGEEVNVVKETKKVYYIEKNGLVKMLPKEMFD